MTSMPKRYKGLAVFLAALILFRAFDSHAFMSSAEDSSETLFFDSPATIHNYKSATDLHNLALGVVAFTELEFIRIGDALLSLPVKGKHRPLSSAADFTQRTFYRLPQVKPVRRIEQLGDALQLRQFSLSDMRFMASLANGSTGGGVTPVMQVRLYKAIILAENLMDDTDRLVMFPANKILSIAREEPIRIKTVGYGSDALGILRNKVFYVLRAFNKAMVKTSSRLLFGLEGAANWLIRTKREQEKKKSMIYVKIPRELYGKHSSFFEQNAESVRVEALNGALEPAGSEPFQAGSFPEETERPLTIAVHHQSKDAVLAGVRADAWRHAPRELKRYVITEDEARLN